MVGFPMYVTGFRLRAPRKASDVPGGYLFKHSLSEHIFFYGVEKVGFLFHPPHSSSVNVTIGLLNVPKCRPVLDAERGFGWAY